MTSKMPVLRSRDDYNENVKKMHANIAAANRAIKDGMAEQSPTTTQSGNPRAEYYTGAYAGKRG